MSASVNRRDFLKGAAASGTTWGAGRGRAIGPNDRIAVGVIGAGLRGAYVARQFARIGESTGACKMVAVCDVYEKRRRDAAVVVATPDHSHARIALDAMARGKDVCRTLDEGMQLLAAVRERKRVFQVRSQTTSAAHWHTTRQCILDGAVGGMIISQGSRHGNSVEGTWNQAEWKIDPDAGPEGKGENHIDWKMWLGTAPSRLFHAQFEGPTDHITLIPERRVITDAYRAKFGDVAKRIPVDRSDSIAPHIGNFLHCMRTRQKPALGVEAALPVQVTVSMAVQSYREDRVLYWDEKAMKVAASPCV